MKRLLAVLFALASCFALTGCESGRSGTASAEPSDAVHAGAAGFSAPSGLSAKSEGILEHVWSGEEYTMPSGWSVKAAVTAIMARTAGDVIPEEPKEFTADEPFSFFIYTTCNDTTTILFAGEIVE